MESRMDWGICGEGKEYVEHTDIYTSAKEVGGHTVLHSCVRPGLPLGLATVKNGTKFVKIIEIDHEFAQNWPLWLR
jgi:hypothetical protein